MSTSSRKLNGELMEELRKVAEEHGVPPKVSMRIMFAFIISVDKKLANHMVEEDQMWLGVAQSLTKLEGVPDRVKTLEATDRRWTAALGVATALGTLAGGLLVMVLKAAKIL